jgi:hypothetical protein
MHKERRRRKGRIKKERSLVEHIILFVASIIKKI